MRSATVVFPVPVGSSNATSLLAAKLGYFLSTSCCGPRRNSCSRTGRKSCHKASGVPGVDSRPTWRKGGRSSFHWSSAPSGSSRWHSWPQCRPMFRGRPPCLQRALWLAAAAAPLTALIWGMVVARRVVAPWSMSWVARAVPAPARTLDFDPHRTNFRTGHKPSSPKSAPKTAGQDA